MGYSGRQINRIRTGPPSQSSSPVCYLIAGFAVRRNGDLSIEVEAATSRAVIEAAHPMFGNGKLLGEGEKGLLGFKKYTFPNGRNAPPETKILYQARLEFASAITW